MSISRLPGFNSELPYGKGDTNGTKKTNQKLQYQALDDPGYTYHGARDNYQREITSKIQDILHGNESISFNELLQTNSDIANIYNRLSDKGKKLVEFVIGLDDDKGNVTERELRNLYRLMDMDGGNADGSFLDNDITDGTGRRMIEDLAQNMPVALEKLRTAHNATKITKELEAEEKEQRKNESELLGFNKGIHIDFSC
ncbi:hypothetical protein IJ579_05485 [bacterium]|nr:hypothetical protein [bacterium]